MTSGNNYTIKAFIDNMCCECGISYSSPSYLIKHMSKQHDIILQPRKQRRSRPRSTKYDFVKSKNIPHRRLLYGCPSCWFYCPQDLNRLAQHYEDIHIGYLDEGYETPIDEEDASDDEEIPAGISRNPAAEKEILEKLSDITKNFKKMFSTKK